MKYIPNVLSFFRLLSVALLVISIDRRCFLFAAAIFILSSITDFLDGYIARKFCCVSKLGSILDPLADKVLVISVYTMLAIENHISMIVACVVVCRDITIMLFVLACFLKKIDIKFFPTMSSKINTVVQLVFISIVLLNLCYSIINAEIICLLSIIVVASTAFSWIEYCVKYYWMKDAFKK